MFKDDIFNPGRPGQREKIRDYGPYPFVTNIEEMARRNRCFRVALWTGEYLQLTLMSIDVGDDIGLEMHNNLDQFIRIER
ncbi:MAG: cupin domain-containing protein, partial [Halanaerobiales bacterium]